MVIRPDRQNNDGYGERRNLIAATKNDGSLNCMARAFSSGLLMIDWHGTADNNRNDNRLIESIGRGIVRATPQLTNIGRIAPIDYELNVYNGSFIQFIELKEFEELGVNYQLSFKNPTSVDRTQICVRECLVPKLSYATGGNSPPLIS